MNSKIGNALLGFSALSFIIGGVQIVLGQTEYNSILVGMQNSYLYFVVAFIILGMAKIIDLLEGIKTKFNK
ncbi:hypothetical protein [Oceanirhabdus sp. W0125-5]|uniref:hypothetical protein n=1 Tax=Oceanirhabdus sp. W0125-5 TaxID=2999116 RepID=UPI0022F33AE2|nr:hypothetical protein [Oceanirhabdus sp. W0125-5]WBW96554.1 hypothetical protein OW730_23105 [Oceanirhabdus sp. W0125-5]